METSASKTKTAGEGRDYSKYRFSGHSYGKSNLVHAIVAQYLKDHPTADIKKLQSVFPRQSVDTLRKAQVRSQDYRRYFLKKDQVLQAGGKKIAVYNQWSKDNISSFIDAAKTLGYRIVHARQLAA